VISVLICLPSLYIFHASGDRRRDWWRYSAVAGLMALMTVLLIGFAPVAWVFSQVHEIPRRDGLVAFGILLVATISALRFLMRVPAFEQQFPTAGIRTWTIIFLLVALQMTTALRPIIGKGATFLPSFQDKKFFVTLGWIASRDDPTGQKPALNGTFPGLIPRRPHKKNHERFQIAAKASEQPFHAGVVCLRRRRARR